MSENKERLAMPTPQEGKEEMTKKVHEAMWRCLNSLNGLSVFDPRDSTQAAMTIYARFEAWRNSQFEVLAEFVDALRNIQTPPSPTQNEIREWDYSTCYVCKNPISTNDKYFVFDFDKGARHNGCGTINISEVRT